MWFEAPVSEIHSISAIVLSKVSAASIYGMSFGCVGLLGTHQHILAICPTIPQY